MDNYQEQAGVFLNDAGYAARVAEPGMLEILKQVIRYGRVIENYKKSAFRGKDIETFPNKEYDLKGTPPDVIHGILGKIGEASELAEVLLESLTSGYTDEVKAKIVDEQGDNAWYDIPLCRGTGVTMPEVLQGNFDKLSARYNKG